MKLEMMELKNKTSSKEEYLTSMHEPRGQASLPSKYHPSPYRPQASTIFGGLGPSWKS